MMECCRHVKRYKSLELFDASGSQIHFDNALQNETSLVSGYGILMEILHLEVSKESEREDVC